jgi:hypothetical protein
MAITYCGTLGDLVTSAKTGTAKYVGNLKDLTVTVTGDTVDASGAMTIEVSQDGTQWSPTSTSSAFTYAAPTGIYTLTGPVAYIRAKATALSSGTWRCRFAGHLATGTRRFGTLGSFTATTGSGHTGSPAGVDDLTDIYVTSTGGASSTVKLQGSYDGTDWITLNTFTTAASYLVKGSWKFLRGNCTIYSATAELRFGGIIGNTSTSVSNYGKGRGGSLGDFATAITGSTLDISDMDSISIAYNNTSTTAWELAIETSTDNAVNTWATICADPTADGVTNSTAAFKYMRSRGVTQPGGLCSVRLTGTNKDAV